ncbi:MAG: 3-deoxy-8-phosphooctulonate synthase [Vampirovibrionia bacterium]
MKKITKVGNVNIGNDKDFVLIAGPCVIENDLSITFNTAEKLKEITTKHNIPLIFKSSFDKANRTSIDSFRGPGLESSISIFEELKKKFNLPLLTDIHEINQIEPISKFVDILQIPAFLSRQTDIIVAAAKSGLPLNIKKGQFLSPHQIIKSADKAIKSGCENICITERGFSFGYGNLVSDMRAIPIIQSYSLPVIFDATHSVQLPGQAGDSTSGERQFVKTLALSSVAAGADGIFIEVHPDPDNAPCDGPNMLPLDEVENLLIKCKKIFETIRE